MGIAELITADLKTKLTVTEFEGGEEIVEEVDDDDDDDSDSGDSSSSEEVKGAAMDLIGSDSLEGDMPLMEAGLDSLAAVEYGSILSKNFKGVDLPSTLMFDHPTTNMIAELITADLKTKLTVTEYAGGETIEVEVEETDDEGDDSSSEDERPKKKKKKAKKPKAKKQVVKKVGGGAPVEVYKGPSAEEILEQVKGAAMDLIGSDSLEGDMPLMEAGLDSLAAVEY